ncbi:Vacuolar protein-sorting-associated protein [Drechslerella dactyloides]|uniref:Vacuolar protein sorting-associated protein 51 homolog n=1 Tax=Drechslerella dactyloides TaxID=74499 RepID=A0AAD6J3C7_DREDA|nr:Vacuolar protein-sorting-associated protein [Drechslerella dactyloides]
MASTPTISVNSPPTSSRPSLDSSAAPSRLSSDSLHSLASLPSHTGTPPIPSLRQHPAAQRRNRSALREFYGLRRRDDESPASGPATRTSQSPSEGTVDGDTTVSTITVSTAAAAADGYLPADELDSAVFDAQGCVDALIGARDLKGLLRVENGLVNDIRGLDGERKSLVYDNYNKLIAATDTIRSMRSNMDPLTPATTTLLPAISHIASVSESLITTVHTPDNTTTTTDSAHRHRASVRHTLDTPDRMAHLLAAGQREAAEREWVAAKLSVARWKGVAEGDVQRFLERGESVLKGG